MKYYHITPTKNLESIFANGLRISRSGMDGPGLYVWNGPLEEAIKNGWFSLRDSHYEKTNDEFNKLLDELSMLEVEIEEEPIIDYGFGDYCVFAYGAPKEKIKYIGNMRELSEA